MKQYIVDNHIAIVQNMCGGKPHIKGHRIRVQDVAIWYEKMDMTPDEIIFHYPTITLSDVHAALAYYFDHREEIEQDIREGKIFIEEFKKEHSSPLQEKLNGTREQADPIPLR